MTRHFSTEFAPRFYDLNSQGQAGPVALLHYLEEAAVSHSRAAGYSLEELKALGVGWVLNRWYLTVERYPVWDERLIVETWPSQFDRFYATREFVVRDGSGEIIARATSRWVYLNIARRRPLRIPEGFVHAYGLDPERALEDAFAALPVGNGEKVPCEAAEKHFEVRRSDLDGYQHVNNAQYVEWVLESMPEETYRSAKLQTLEIEYKKELGYGGRAQVRGTPWKSDREIGLEQGFPSGDNFVYLHFIEDLAGKRELAVARTTWKRGKAANSGEKGS